MFALKYIASGFIWFVKGKSVIYEKLRNIKYKYRNKGFYYKAYCISNIQKHEIVTESYIWNQLKEDEASEKNNSEI